MDRTCSTCKYLNLSIFKEPCWGCVNKGNYSNYEAAKFDQLKDEEAPAKETNTTAVMDKLSPQPLPRTNDDTTCVYCKYRRVSCAESPCAECKFGGGHGYSSFVYFEKGTISQIMHCDECKHSTAHQGMCPLRHCNHLSGPYELPSDFVPDHEAVAKLADKLEAYDETKVKDAEITVTDVTGDNDGVEQPATDAVNHPNHYTFGKIEVIDYIRDKLTAEEFQGYCEGNVLKYVSRWRHKGGVEDLKKARVYLTWMIESAMGEEKSE